MLGTNDTKQRFAMSAPAIAQALARLIRLCHLYALDGRGETDARFDRRPVAQLNAWTCLARSWQARSTRAA